MDRLRKERALLHKKAVSHSLRKGVKLMGKERWTKVLRFLVCFLIALAVMTYIAPKAC